jgi:hypothetical protein
MNKLNHKKKLKILFAHVEDHMEVIQLYFLMLKQNMMEKYHF